MTTLYATRGLIASGKTTLAKKWVAGHEASRARINRDDARAMAHNGVHLRGATEKQIVAIRDASISALLNTGIDVICDDTNLPQRTIRGLMALATRCGADFFVHDLTHVPLEECLWRDSLRPKPVGEDVIRGMHTRYLRGRRAPLPLPTVRAALPLLEPYTPPLGAPKVVLADLDGTLCLANGRNPYDESRVLEDLPNPQAIETIRDRHRTGHTIIGMSGRTEACRENSTKWLAKHLGVPIHDLYMRAVGDTRPDDTVKAELFDKYIRRNYDVRLVLDDRNRVVEMWRSLGLIVFQVAPGDF